MKQKLPFLVLALGITASCKDFTSNPDVKSRPKSIENFVVDDTPLDPGSLVTTDDTPDKLVCHRRAGSVLVGDMSYRAPTGLKRVGAFTSGQVGHCEMSRRAARRSVVCVEKSGSFDAVKIDGLSVVKSFGSSFEDCLRFTQSQGSGLAKAGLQFIDPKDLSAYLKNLPHIEDPHLDDVLHSSSTVWYDENSMVFTYQDSFGSPTGPEGLRANRVGYDVGSTASEPGIRALVEYFELQGFKYPFSITAGRFDRDNAQAIYFWSLPRDRQGRAIPVTYWKNGSHWHWVFPVGTVIGELLLLRGSGSASEWYAHEVRTREREIDHWKTDIFRPFPRAVDMAAAIKRFRRNWQSSDLKQLVEYLENDETLTPGLLDSKSYERVVPSINGYYDQIPGTKDYALIRTLLSKVMYRSAMGAEWKRSGDKVSYAPTTMANFHIVPRRYIAGLLENSEKSCARCHAQTGRPLGQLDPRTVLYGEIWGEDQVFTWHPFKVTSDIYTVSDHSRAANPKLIEAGLLIEKKPSPQDPLYRELPRPYVPSYR